MRRLVFAVVVAVCLVVAIAYVGRATLRERSAPGQAEVVTPAARAALASLGRSTPRVVFQHVARDDDYARIAVAASAGGRRTIVGRVCERVHFAAGRGLCLLHTAGLAPRFAAMILDRDLRMRERVELPGIVSRARVSRDGRYGAATSFVTGHSYRDKGFSTHTVLLDMAAGAVIADLEEFAITRGGERIRSEDFNFWGVTFAPSGDRFYATLATAGKTYLVEGSVAERRARVLRDNVECPSLSRDGGRIAFKKRVGETWRLSVLDLATMRETPLAETRSVDDQAEWLDDEHVLYGLNGDVWRVRADGRGRPVRFLRDALSPAVVPAGRAA
jgi:hypothetical protein